MTRKLILTILFSIVMFLSFYTVSFAESNNTTTTLGNEVTSSMNKTERSMNDLVDRTEMDNAGRTIENGARTVGNTVSNGMDNIGRGIENFFNNDIEENKVTDNRAVAGTTGNYTAGQQVQDTSATNDRMSGNAWIWVVMIVVALIIVAVVWYYAASQN